MTWREKFYKENPDVIVSKHIGGCPKDMHDKMPSECPDHCSDCWDREIPEEYLTADGDKVELPDLSEPDPVVNVIRAEVIKRERSVEAETTADAIADMYHRLIDRGLPSGTADIIVYKMIDHGYFDKK